MFEIGELGYLHNGEYAPLPSWGNSLLRLGQHIGQTGGSDNCSVVCLVLPTRAFGAALLSFGVVLGRLAATRGDDETSKEHVEHLSNLRMGDSVTILDGARRTKGEFRGIKTSANGAAMICVRQPVAKGGGLTRWFIPEYCAVSRLPSGGILLVPGQAPAENLIPNPTFVSRFLPEERLLPFATRSVMECLVIGNLNVLRSETTDTVFASYCEPDGTRGAGEPQQLRRETESEGAWAEGKLHDILRTRRFLGENRTYRADVLAAQARTTPDRVADAEDAVVVFDGAMAFLKWSSYCSPACKIVLLDRTEPRFDDAVQQINAKYVMRTGDAADLMIRPLAAGIETVAYREGPS